MCLWDEREVIPSDHTNVREATENEIARIKASLSEAKADGYIAVTTDTDIFLVGPFESYDAAAEYPAKVDVTTLVGDNDWKCVTLTDTFGLRIVTPPDPKTLPAALLETPYASE
jgi:hypothetical protein